MDFALVHPPSPRTRRRSYPPPHGEPPAHLLPHHGQRLNLDFYDPAYRQIFTDSIPTPPPLSLAPAVPSFHSPLESTSDFTTPILAHSDSCSSCCDQDNCSDNCDNEDCTDGCTDGCHIDFPACDLDNCKGTTKCPGSPCIPASSPCPQSESTPCQTVVCKDESCAADTPACPVECAEGAHSQENCQEKNCQGQCSTLRCASTCSEFDCVKATCKDYHCADPTAHQPPAYPDSRNCVSFHVNNANSSRWQPSNHSEAVYYSNVSPNSLTLDSHFHHRYDALHHLPFGDFGLSQAPSAPTQPAKRRKMSDISHATTPGFDHSYSTAPSSTAPTPASSSMGDIPCLWEDGCHEAFLDHLALQDHIRNTHIGSQITHGKCLWGGCGLESADPNSLFDHIRTSHAPQRHVCMWAGCTAVCHSVAELQAHINTHLPSANQCQWNSCSGFASPEVNLEKHIQNQHLYPLPIPVEQHTDKRIESALPSLPSSTKTCEWTNVDAQGSSHVCGRVFQSPVELQQHAKEVHITALKKRTGYYCHWAGCSRMDKPFSQKGKVERHLQTHTGCEFGNTRLYVVLG
jgi:hypothetical protein